MLKNITYFNNGFPFSLMNLFQTISFLYECQLFAFMKVLKIEIIILKCINIELFVLAVSYLHSPILFSMRWFSITSTLRLRLVSVWKNDALTSAFYGLPTVETLVRLDFDSDARYEYWHARYAPDNRKIRKKDQPPKFRNL